MWAITVHIFLPWSIIWAWKPASAIFDFFLSSESLLTPHLAPSRPFTGCIRHFVIDGRPVSFNKAALVSGAVSINSCPAAWHSRAKTPKYKVLQSTERNTEPAGGNNNSSSGGSFQLVGQDISESSGTGCLLLPICILTLDPNYLQCMKTEWEWVLNLLVLLPAGEITVPVSNKIEGILNKHWHTFLKCG